MANASVRPKKTIKKKTVKVAKPKLYAAKFRLLKNCVSGIRFFVGFYAFLNVLFWLAYSAKIVGQKGIYVIFKPAWQIVNKFYTYKPVHGKEEIDFTGIVCAICLMVIAIILKSVYEYLAELEENAKIEDAKRIERAEKKALAIAKGNLKPKNNALKKDAGFVFLLDIDIKQVSGFIQEQPFSPEEIAKIKMNFFTSLLNNLNLNQVVQKGYYKKKLFLIYKNVSYFDDFIFYTKETLNSLLKEFTRPTLRIDFLVGLNSLETIQNFKEKLDLLDTVNKLGLRNEFICTQSLRDIYEYMPKKQYYLNSRGFYNLSKNLNVSNNQEIFSLKEN